MKIQARNKIEAYQEKIKYGQFDDGECSICYSAPHVDKTSPPCGHVFCYQCLKSWIKHKSKCPVCIERFFEIKRGNHVKVIANQQLYNLSVLLMNLLRIVFIVLCLAIICFITWRFILIRLVPGPLIFEMDKIFNFPISKVELMLLTIYTIIGRYESYNTRLARPYRNMFVSIIFTVIVSWILYTWWYYAENV